MTLKEFWLMNDNINRYDEITLHDEDASYNKEVSDPICARQFFDHANWIVERFFVDDNGHWHLRIF